MPYVKNTVTHPINRDEVARFQAGESRESLVESRPLVFVPDPEPEPEIVPVPKSAEIELAQWRWRQAKQDYNDASPHHKGEALAKVTAALQALHALEGGQ